MTKDKPNLIYVFADQLRFDALHCHGNDNAITPNIDSFAKQAADMNNAVSCHPVCAPYRATLFTGKHTPSTGMVINELRINPNHRTFANVLDDAGYETCYLGKWHMYANQFNNHYNTKNSYIPKGPDRLGFNDKFAGYNFHHKYYAPEAYYHLDSEEKIYCKGYEPSFMTGMAIDEIKRLASNKDKPFALFLSLGTPHDPWTEDNVPKEYLDLFKNKTFKLPENYSEKDDRHLDRLWAGLNKNDRKKLTSWMKVYSAMVSELDNNFGRILKAIKDNNLDDNTIVVFTSDHGEMFGSHGRRAKNIYYEEAIKVPFLVRFGNRLPAGNNSSCFGSVDIMPTLLTLMGLEYPTEVDGKNLSDCLYGKADNTEGSLLMGTGAVALWFKGFEWRGIRNKQYTYAVWKKDNDEYLFDNVNDPLQLKNLANDRDFCKIKENLRCEMLRQMSACHDEFLTVNEFRKKYIKHRCIQDISTLRK